MKIAFVVCVDDEIEKNQMFGVRYMPVWAYTLASYLRDIPGVEMLLWDTRIKSRAETPYADVRLWSLPKLWTAFYFVFKKSMKKEFLAGI
jgi:hypothetical protein